MVVNRLVPIGIVIFRYIMVCKAILALRIGEKLLASIVYKFMVWIPILYGVTTFFYLRKVRIFCICMGGEEQFIFETSDFLANSKFGSSFKLPFLNPFRLSFNIIAFSFVVVVPSFYFLIYKFRDSQNSSVPGEFHKTWIFAKLSPSSSFSWAEFSFNFSFTPPTTHHPGKVGKLGILPQLVCQS